ncbi:hypothetical protein [Streptomyces sp. NPDC048142]|uniref:hypothetical protein n=1 Tax=Streptomyces sp. NPDC048142 TaxID=3365501 RepID=UPI0037125C45
MAGAITDKNGVRYFAWELSKDAIDRRYGVPQTDEDVEAYDWQLARMGWLKANVSH